MGDGAPKGSVVTLRPFDPGEAPLIIAGRDAAFRRFIGEGSAVPSPEFAARHGFERGADVEGRTFWRRHVAADR